MKTSGTVYRKLREVKYRYMVEMYKKYLCRSPDHCKFNKPFRIQTDGMVRTVSLCMLHQPAEGGIVPHLLDICEQVGNCTECNAYVCRYTKESVKEMFEVELKNDNLKARKYPDICALEWVLERRAEGIPPFTWFFELYYRIKRGLSKPEQ